MTEARCPGCEYADWASYGDLEPQYVVTIQCPRHLAEHRYLHPAVVTGSDGIPFIDEGVKPR